MSDAETTDTRDGIKKTKEEKSETQSSKPRPKVTVLGGVFSKDGLVLTPEARQQEESISRTRKARVRPRKRVPGNVFLGAARVEDPIATLARFRKLSSAPRQPYSVYVDGTNPSDLRKFSDVDHPERFGLYAVSDATKASPGLVAIVGELAMLDHDVRPDEDRQYISSLHAASKRPLKLKGVDELETHPESKFVSLDEIVADGDRGNRSFKNAAKLAKHAGGYLYSQNEVAWRGFGYTDATIVMMKQLQEDRLSEQAASAFLQISTFASLPRQDRISVYVTDGEIYTRKDTVRAILAGLYGRLNIVKGNFNKVMVERLRVLRLITIANIDADVIVDDARNPPGISQKRLFVLLTNTRLDLNPVPANDVLSHVAVEKIEDEDVATLQDAGTSSPGGEY
jgi:hypothetical protein